MAFATRILDWRFSIVPQQIPVPEGHARIAQRFNVGLASINACSPEETVADTQSTKGAESNSELALQDLGGAL